MEQYTTVSVNEAVLYELVRIPKYIAERTKGTTNEMDRTVHTGCCHSMHPPEIAESL